eukprot:scpid106335/ scgid30570/ 
MVVGLSVESSSGSGGTNRPPRVLPTNTDLEGGGSGGGRGAVTTRGTARGTAPGKAPSGTDLANPRAAPMAVPHAPPKSCQAPARPTQMSEGERQTAAGNYPAV